MARLTASKARANLADTLNRVAYQRERIVLYRRGKDLAAVVPMSDYELLEKLEDKLDVEAAMKALAESKERIPYDQVRHDLGLGK